MQLSEYTSSTSIYLQQMQNYIDLGQGYNTLRKLLFQQLHQSDGNQQVADDKLADAIIANLTQNLNDHVNFHQTQKIFRTLQIIEDLITYTEQIITPSMHNQNFISALVSVALPRIVSFNPTMQTQNRNRTLGIFLFWFERYAREEECPFELFISAFKHLRDKKLTFPSMITIKPNDYFKNEALKQKQKSSQIKILPQVSSNLIILNDISQFTAKTEILQRQNIRSIVTTQYVRLIKHKSKILYEFTTKPNEFNQQQKNIVKDLYKRLRAALKQIDKYNESNIQTKKMKEQQQNYVELKNTPTKSKDSPASKHNLSGKKQTNQPSLSLQTVQDLLEDKHATVAVPVKGRIQPSPPVFNDLLDMGVSVKPPSPLNIEKKISFPQKSITVDADLLSDVVIQPKVQEEQQFFDGILVDTGTILPKSLTPHQNQATLFQIFQSPHTPIKSNKQQEDKPLVKLSSHKSVDSDPSFQNQKKIKNPYSYIPDNLNLTPSSSANQEDQDRIKEDIGFNLFGLKKIDFENVKEIYQSQSRYDDLPDKIKKAESLDSPKKGKTDNQTLISLDYPPLDAPEILKKITPADYSKYLLQRSPVSQKSESDEQNHLGLKIKSSILQKQLDQSPSQNKNLKQSF